MKRRQFVKAAALGPVAASPLAAAAGVRTPAQENGEIYEFRVYTLRGGGAVQPLSEYLRTALIPVLNRHGVARVGVFREMASPEPPKIYVLIPYADMGRYAGMAGRLADDADYQAAAKSYDEIPLSRQVYHRYDSWLLQAFRNIPRMEAPAPGDRIFELRTYEGYSEDAVRRKVAMFNDGELDIFYKTGLHPVFFGHMLAGPNLPALTYMLSFRNMAERESNWKAFIDHPDWKRISALPEYADTVSKIIRVFLEPVDFSQV